jgi:hypothetical protein
MVTMAVRQAAAKAKPVEGLRIMTITCNERPGANAREGVSFRESERGKKRI